MNFGTLIGLNILIYVLFRMYILIHIKSKYMPAIIKTFSTSALVLKTVASFLHTKRKIKFFLILNSVVYTSFKMFFPVIEMAVKTPENNAPPTPAVTISCPVK